MELKYLIDKSIHIFINNIPLIELIRILINKSVKRFALVFDLLGCLNPYRGQLSKNQFLLMRPTTLINEFNQKHTIQVTLSHLLLIKVLFETL